MTDTQDKKDGTYTLFSQFGSKLVTCVSVYPTSKKARLTKWARLANPRAHLGSRFCDTDSPQPSSPPQSGGHGENGLGTSNGWSHLFGNGTREWAGEVSQE